MHGTIEPRLIALLNDSPPDYSLHKSSRSLPPLQNAVPQKSLSRLSPLEPDAGTRNVEHSSLASSRLREAGNGVAVTVHDDLEAARNIVPERTLGESSPQSIRKILDNTDGAVNTQQKRDWKDTSKEDFVQLPQPPKKLKAPKQSVPPIIIGLYEPPPQTTLFPPIASSSFHDSHGRNTLNIVPLPSPKSTFERERRLAEPTLPESASLLEEGHTTELTSVPKQLRRHWTDEETTHLLKGVEKHGIGKWAVILKDGDFDFNERKAVDLKDRWRVICPNELRTGASTRRRNCHLEDPADSRPNARSKTRHSSLLDNTLLSSSSDSDDTALPTVVNVRKSKAHRKNLCDLAKIGISQPLLPSKRRARRPFTDEEDVNILLGFAEHGNQWAHIVKDAKLALMHRRPTDIRDRVRNRWPDRYAAVAMSGSAMKPTDKENNVMIAQSKKTLLQKKPQPSANQQVAGLPAEQIKDNMHPDVENRATSNSQDSVLRAPFRCMPGPQASSPFVNGFHGLPTMATNSTSGGTSTTTAPAPTQFMSFSEMLNDNDWSPNDGSGLQGLESDAVGEMDISRLLSATFE